MNKTIQINPELFKFTGTRKRSVTPKEITVKVPKEQNTTLSKRNSLMKFIRRHQEDKNTLKNRNHNQSCSEVTDNGIQSDFDKSLQFLIDVTDKETDAQSQDISENVNLKFPENITPQYGCLKNGTLPTYRQLYGNQTMKKHHKPTGQLGRTFHSHQRPYTLDNTPKEDYRPSYIEQNNQYNSTEADTGQLSRTFHSHQRPDNPIEDYRPSYIEQNNQYNSTEADTQTNHDNAIISQKKLLKRTYRIGKCNADRKISVLVSNKTIRHHTSDKNQNLKKTNLLDVRRYLVKHGLIKIGSTAPPDVLRKMFESASMVCGNITNHNSETLLYNYMNPEKI